MVKERMSFPESLNKIKNREVNLKDNWAFYSLLKIIGLINFENKNHLWPVCWLQREPTITLK